MTCRGQTSDVLDFMKVINITNYEQRLGILRNINKSQCGIIRQVAYNILFNKSIELSDKDKAYMKRHSSSIKTLASRKICLVKKKAVLVSKNLLIKRLAKITIAYLS